jgi:hydroxymethylpyrimidine pyrophosphatase-like HAD family hydrolase
MKTLYISDLDGTLLNNSGELSAFSIKTINELINRGMCFSYATARSSTSASRVTRGLTTNVPVMERRSKIKIG